MSDIILLGQNFLALFVESAPWLLLGLLVAGIMHELVPVSFLEKHMGSSSFGSITKAAVIGAPLPLCSCGVIPAALGLRRSGASKSSTISFLVSTPETGVDSVSVSYALLGPLYAIVRPIAAITSAIYAGLMVRFFAEAEEAQQRQSDVTQSSCCGSKQAPKPEPQIQASTSCCASEKTHAHNHESTDKPKQESSPSKITSVLSYASGKLLEDIVIWLLIGLALAAAIKTWVPTDFLTQWGDGVVAMLVMALIGIPMYICATASTPLAVGFLAAGPATNVSTMGMIKQEMGTRTLVLYLFSVISASIGFGYALNYLVSSFSLASMIKTQSHVHEHGADVQVIYGLCAILLAGLMLRLGMKKLQQHRHNQEQHSACCG